MWLGKYTDTTFPQGITKAILEMTQEQTKEVSTRTGLAGEGLKKTAQGDQSWTKFSKLDGRSPVGEGEEQERYQRWEEHLSQGRNYAEHAEQRRCEAPVEGEPWEGRNAKDVGPSLVGMTLKSIVSAHILLTVKEELNFPLTEQGPAFNPTTSQNFWRSPKDGELISQMRKLRPREVQGLPQGHTAASGKAKVATQVICLLVPFLLYRVCHFSDWVMKMCAEGRNWIGDVKPQMSEWQVIPQ